MKHYFTTFVALGVFGASVPVFAQQGGFSLDKFQPAPAGDRFFGVQGGDLGPFLVPRLMLLGDYAYRPLVLYRGASEQEVGEVVANQLVLHLAGTLALRHRIALFADMPLALLQTGANPSLGGTVISSPSGAALGDLRAGLRWRLMGAPRSLASLSLSGSVVVPTGQESQFMGDGKVHVTPTLVFYGEDDSLAYAASAGVDLCQKSEFATRTLGSQVVFGAGLAFLAADRMVQIGPEIYGSTMLVGSDLFGRATTNLEGILGMKVHLGPVVFGMGAGPGVTRGLGTPTLRGILSVTYAPVLAKAAPPPPPPLPPRQEPPPPADRDKDGIVDQVDACPEVPGIADSDPSKNGCPPPPPDRDGDGVFDKDDTCPDVKGVASDDPVKNGCPPDTDGDGIRDDVDACPKEKGPADPDARKNGCPAAVRVTDTEVVILEQVQFKTGSAELLKASDDLLRQVAGVLADHPEIVKIEIQGHTDNQGGARYNRKLSEKRAASVVEWLAKKGLVDAGRLTSHGFGLDEPIADNATREGRQKNRRVEFKILEKASSEKAEVSP